MAPKVSWIVCNSKLRLVGEIHILQMGPHQTRIIRAVLFHEIMTTFSVLVPESLP